MLDQLTIRGRLVAAAMKLAAERPWREVTLAQIAATAGVSLVDVRREFDTKADVLAAFVRSVDDAVLARAPPGLPSARMRRSTSRRACKRQGRRNGS
ncbi:MAG: helix-turn-helix domain-containing protein [Hyphomicrobium sp.]|nr:helix-turn-helix domain-containing protein [Hyphomicrobium sp.]